MKYAIVEIQGRQYRIEPGKELLVNNLGEIKNLVCDRVLLMVVGDKVAVGMPYLKETLEFEVLENLKGPKIRVAKYHSKANTRKVKGSRSKLSKVKLVDSAKTVKKS
jgi:large subunit ribosomal protein L21